MSAAGRTVVITGASRGLGRGCALAFAAEGAEVVLVARNADQLDEVAGEITALGGNARATPCDVTRPEEVREMFGALSRCDVLVNNAGTNHPQPFLEVDVKTLDELLTLNVRSMFITAQAAARVMAPRRSGVIINMSSQMGHIGAANRTVYCMTKHAIEGLTKALAEELPEGMAAIPLNPGIINTDMLRKCWPDGAAGYPTPEKWAETAAPFILSLGPKHNGQSLSVKSFEG